MNLTNVSTDQPLDRRLFHITSPEVADALLADHDHSPASLEVEGFVHLSTAAQVVQSTERHFEPDADLRLVEIDPELLQAEVRWPEVYPGERFPHLHGPLNASAVVQVHRWCHGDRAVWSAD